MTECREDLIKKVDELHAAQAKNSEKLDLLEVTEQGPFSQVGAFFHKLDLYA